MNKHSVLFLAIFSLIQLSCSRDENRAVEIPIFNFPETITFKTNLSSYNIYQGTASELVPANDFHLYELSSSLFTDFAYKQRLVKLPVGQTMN